jgi:hypothetical protein
LEIAMATHIGVMLAAAFMLAPGAAAQVITGEATGEKKTFVEARGNVVPVPLPPGGQSPRMADGKVDLSGVWFEGPTGKANAWSVIPDARVEEDPIPFQPWADAKIKSMTRTEIELSRANVRCEPVGTPGMFNQNPYPQQIDTKPGLFIHLIENNNNWRVVHTDGRPHKPKDELEPLFNGDQTARWDGDTLVIDTVSLDERTLISGNGWFHSDQVHVIERLRRPSRNYLEYQYTVEDPKVLTKPWTSAWRTYSLGNEDLTENFCTNNENADQLRKLTEVESKQK